MMSAAVCLSGACLPGADAAEPPPAAVLAPPPAVRTAAERAAVVSWTRGEQAAARALLAADAATRLVTTEYRLAGLLGIAPSAEVVHGLGLLVGAAFARTGPEERAVVEDLRRRLPSLTALFRRCPKTEREVARRIAAVRAVAPLVVSMKSAVTSIAEHVDHGDRFELFVSDGLAAREAGEGATALAHAVFELENAADAPRRRRLRAAAARGSLDRTTFVRACGLLEVSAALRTRLLLTAELPCLAASRVRLHHWYVPAGGPPETGGACSHPLDGLYWRTYGRSYDWLELDRAVRAGEYLRAALVLDRLKAQSGDGPAEPELAVWEAFVRRAAGGSVGYRVYVDLPPAVRRSLCVVDFDRVGRCAAPTIHCLKAAVFFAVPVASALTGSSPAAPRHPVAVRASTGGARGSPKVI